MPRRSEHKVRYGVVGLGHIAQNAVLPAFEHAENAVLSAIVSSDQEKLDMLGDAYRVANRATYEQYDKLLDSRQIDAIYIALPNHMHCDFAVRAAKAGVHVLCEKPMAVTSEECRTMIRAARQRNVRLMTAYRLHFDPANLEAVEIVRSEYIGDARLFASVFSIDVKAGDIRLGPIERGGGTLYDIGIYCINAARYLFRAEPIEVMATTARSADPRFRECDESASVMLRFPGERLATFVTSFSAAPTSAYRVLGTKGELRMEPAYDYETELSLEITMGGKTEHRTFAPHDQFAPELIHFSKCIVEGREPEPGGAEGWADVRVIEAAYRSALTRRPIKLEPFVDHPRPDIRQAIHRPPSSPKQHVKI
jgi:predicted dehydrogenase